MTAYTKYYKEHPEYREKKLKQMSDYQKKNLEKIQANHRNLFHERRMKAFELLGGCCANPYGLHDKPFTDWRCLQIDHINGGGCKHYKLRQTWGIISDVLKDPDRKKKYQLLCANCNWIKRWENNEHNDHNRMWEFREKE